MFDRPRFSFISLSGTSLWPGLAVFRPRLWRWGQRVGGGGAGTAAGPPTHRYPRHAPHALLSTRQQGHNLLTQHYASPPHTCRAARCLCTCMPALSPLTHKSVNSPSRDGSFMLNKHVSMFNIFHLTVFARLSSIGANACFSLTTL